MTPKEENNSYKNAPEDFSAYNKERKSMLKEAFSLLLQMNENQIASLISEMGGLK